MAHHKDDTSKPAKLTKAIKPDKCAENGTWTSPPPPPSLLTPLDFSTIDSAENQRVTASGKMTFSMVGCSGDPGTPPTKTQAVAAAMIKAGASSFFYHLGDITYTAAEKGSGSSADDATSDDEYLLWNDQFYEPYANYPKQIVSIAGNHHGKHSKTIQKSQIANYLANFCADPSK